jgi:hypothetical protein
LWEQCIIAVLPLVGDSAGLGSTSLAPQVMCLSLILGYLHLYFFLFLLLTRHDSDLPEVHYSPVQVCCNRTFTFRAHGPPLFFFFFFFFFDELQFATIAPQVILT